MELSDYKKLWDAADESFRGNGGFLDGSYLVQYIREDDEKFKNRKEIAYYTNIFASKVNRYIGYIYKKPPIRSSKNNLISLIFDDANNRGDSINVFMTNFSIKAKVKGVNLVLVEMLKDLPSNLKEQIDNRLLPYLVEIEPQRVTKYRLDKFGKFEYIYFDDTMIINDEIETITRLYDKNDWKIIKDDKVLDSGKHNLGVCPVLYFSESGEFLSAGEFTQVAPIAKRHYNLQSELDEILRYQTFPILTINGDVNNDGGEVEVNTSNDSAIIYSDGLQQPNFIAPPSAPAQLYQSRLIEIENYISTICYDTSVNQGTESGIALDIKFQGLNSSLSNFSSRVEDFERRVFAVVCKYLKATNDIEINYPKTFSIIDINSEINILSAMKDLIDSPTYFKQKAIQIINNDLTNIEIEEFDIIKGELDDIGKEV